jgi:hypothetical protein
MSSNKPNGQVDQGKATSGADITELSSLLSQESPEGDADVAELLRTIETADGMAQGVESKLDNMLQNLDRFLASLESNDIADNPAESSITPEDKESK